MQHKVAAYNSWKNHTDLRSRCLIHSLKGFSTAETNEGTYAGHTLGETLSKRIQHAGNGVSLRWKISEAV